MKIATITACDRRSFIQQGCLQNRDIHFFSVLLPSLRHNSVSFSYFGSQSLLKIIETTGLLDTDLCHVATLRIASCQSGIVKDLHISI